MPDPKPSPGAPNGPHADKHCATCGRTITWRKKFASNWDEVKFCSDGCRRHKPDSTDTALETAILDLLKARGRGKTICPSEAARAIKETGWEDLMEPARRAARRLVAAGRIDILQKNKVVDGSTAKGPIRLRLRGT
ncbi:DUF2256 and DUF3253 domain-containing protein [Granulicella sibirica]|uniref:DUF3253 domain-containing protein n=1 Tax=Granulicella sibirica TaxID=2479048 RepID=A0A4Q0SX67_9BACT|nr:DUF2256 and DUF3253 domain-containing protein [Granulicella sibirica]RXH55703.1 hypothetical protein GRAN_2560 [Granulicella sibirica]